MKHIILSIDTSDSDRTRVALSIDGKRFEKMSQSKFLKAQTVLPLIEDVLKSQNVPLSNVKEIVVHMGSGSFTGLRVGAAIANALGFFLQIPVNGQRTLVVPLY